MKTIKTLLLGLTFGVLIVGSFSQAQFYSESVYKESNETLTPKSRRLIKITDDFYSFGVLGGSDCGTWEYTTTPNCTDYNYCQWSSLTFPGNGGNCLLLKSNLPLGTTTIYCKNYSNQKMVITTLSENMPVSELAPVITGLTNSINEFIPYVVYVGLGVLGAVIGFVAIKRLLRFVKGSSLSVFRFRKKRK